jgi:hypothetical protein
MRHPSPHVRAAQGEIARRVAAGASGAPDGAGSILRTVYDVGGNFEIEIERGVAICRIWTRPDVDRMEGARFALQNVEAFKRLAEEPASVVRAVVLDLTRAPAMWGSIIQSCLERMVAILESAQQAIAVLSQDAMQSEQMQRILRAHAPLHGRLFASFGEAWAWAHPRR